jgi:hypothetical protein
MTLLKKRHLEKVKMPPTLSGADRKGQSHAQQRMDGTKIEGKPRLSVRHSPLEGY